MGEKRFKRVAQCQGRFMRPHAAAPARLEVFEFRQWQSRQAGFRCGKWKLGDDSLEMLGCSSPLGNRRVFEQPADSKMRGYGKIGRRA
jgi:hypothetical protein